MKFRRFLPLTLLLLGFVVLIVVASRAKEEPLSSTLKVGQPVPEMELRTLTGETVRLSEQRGKVVVVDFWATWCPPCVLSLPHLQEVADDRSLADRGLVVWAVNSSESPNVVRQFVERNKLSFTVPLDAGSASTAMGVLGLPTTIIVGRDGNVSHLILGFDRNKTPAELKSAIETALAKQ